MSLAKITEPPRWKAICDQCGAEATGLNTAQLAEWMKENGWFNGLIPTETIHQVKLMQFCPKCFPDLLKIE